MGKIVMQDGRAKLERPQTCKTTVGVDARHIGAHGRALSKLWAAFAAYQEWQEDQGDVATFLSWVEDELPGLFPATGG